MKKSVTAALFCTLMINASNGHTSSPFELINTLNHTLQNQFQSNDGNFNGITNIATVQKNQQLIIQVTHNPRQSYRQFIDKLAENGGRVNGVNFQNSLTLTIVDNYCQNHLFAAIKNAGLSDSIAIKYQDLQGKFVALHNINQKLCSHRPNHT